MVPGRVRVGIGETPTANEGSTPKSIPEEAHLVQGTSPGELRLVVSRGPHSAPCAQKRAVRTRGAQRKSRPNAPRARKSKRKGDTVGAWRRVAVNCPELPATRG